MKLSIIIPTYNEEKYLPKLLDSIKLQKVDFEYEIIVADNKSKDDTVKIAQEYGCIMTLGGLPAEGRNKGAKVAKGKRLFFMDADVRLKDEYSLQSYISKIELNQEFVVGTPFPYSIKEEKNILTTIFYSLTFINQIFLKSTGGGYAILIKRKVFELMGGFDEQLYLSEDHDLIRRARLYGVHKKLLPYIEVSNRRLIKDGYLKTIYNYTVWSLMYFMGKKFKKDKYEKIYGFGHK